MKSLEGKVAIVTGASRGIGRAISIAFAEQGANLILAARTVPELKEVQTIVSKFGVKSEIVQTDVLSEEQIINMFKRTIEVFGRLDILVNNAGVFLNEPIDQMSTQTWDWVVDIELRAPFICTREAMRIMKPQGGGRIINIGSISAQRVRAFTAPYNAAKWGLVGLTHTTALEGREFGITCGILHPGITADRATAEEPLKTLSFEETAATAVFMAAQPPHSNVFEVIQIPIEQPYLGRG
jgi:NAD(P)-dependent dehydrogenase (short-subunit alcohol dehydrogenase family)